MAFIISMPKSFKVGDSAPVTINGNKTTLTYEDAATLRIGATDRRIIRTVHDQGNLNGFLCTDADGTLDVNVVQPDLDGNPTTKHFFVDRKKGEWE